MWATESTATAKVGRPGTVHWVGEAPAIVERRGGAPVSSENGEGKKAKIEEKWERRRGKEKGGTRLHHLLSRLFTVSCNISHRLGVSKGFPRRMPSAEPMSWIGNALRVNEGQGPTQTGAGSTVSKSVVISGGLCQDPINGSFIRQPSPIR